MLWSERWTKSWETGERASLPHDRPSLMEERNIVFEVSSDCHGESLALTQGQETRIRSKFACQETISEGLFGKFLSFCFH